MLSKRSQIEGTPWWSSGYPGFSSLWFTRSGSALLSGAVFLTAQEPVIHLGPLLLF